MPSSCVFGAAGSPMNAKFWLPYWSSWLPPMITCRRPDHTTSNIARYGLYPATTFSGLSTPTGMMFSTSNASPSVMTSSGATVALARRPPIIGSVPIGLARISPSPRNASATATAQTSARVKALIASPRAARAPRTGTRPRRRPGSARGSPPRRRRPSRRRRSGAGRPRRGRSRAGTR